MNFIFLLIAFGQRVRTCYSLLLRIFLAIGTLSLEMQIVTWAHVGSLRKLVWLNAVVAALVAGRVLFFGPAGVWRVYQARPALQVPVSRPTLRFVPWAGLAVLALIVVVLNTTRPLAAADPYHLHRVAQIERLGSLAYDPSAPDVKTNILAGTYELVLADLGAVPRIGASLLKLHGLLGLSLYLIAIGAAFEWLDTRSRLGALALLFVPVVFHQFVLIKNDLFGAIPAFAALVWLVRRADQAPLGEVVAAGWLAGFALGVKLSSFPVALALAGGVVVLRRSDWRPFAAVVVAGIGGAIAAGLLLTASENVHVYGALAEPYASLGNRHAHLRDAVVGLGRLALSLVDLGLLTRVWWPGRGGWGGTFGVTLIWAIAVLVVRRARPDARRALWVAATCFLLFGLVYPDADLAQRLMLAPGLLLLAVAVACVEDDDPSSPAFRRALIVAVTISVAQIARSAVLYLM